MRHNVNADLGAGDGGLGRLPCSFPLSHSLVGASRSGWLDCRGRPTFPNPQPPAPSP